MDNLNQLSVPERHQANRCAWNEAAQFYETKVEQDIAFLRAGGRHFLPVELPYLRDLGSWCKRAIHLQCAAGRDTLSLWNQGAAEVIGLDISERMIRAARLKSDALNAPARWYCCDVLDAPHELDETADLVYTGRGALCWLMDIVGWSRTVVRLLKPEGRLYVFEGHPLDWVWDLTASELRFDPQPPYGDYFSPRVSVDREWPATYIPASSLPPVNERTPKHGRQWTLGQILSSLAEAGLRLERFEEHPDLFCDLYPNLPKDIVARLPHTFSLLMRKS